MNKNDIVDIIFQTHTSGKERIIIFKIVASQLENEDISETLKEFVVFFSSHLPLHFKSEEILIDILKTIELPVNNINDISNLLTEHKSMEKELEELKIQVEKSDSALQEDSIQKMNKLIEQLFQHSKKEDQILFPLAQEKINGKLKEKLRSKIEHLHKNIS
ncbi:MAG: hemerythrin domain-containing protein [Thermodesulfobacteriota bacterium]|nr:hemerythrin domain-containing protein [Thermodesulfobacteriota bacterium]